MIKKDSTVYDYLKSVIDADDKDLTREEKAIRYAYWIGREEATQHVSDTYSALLKEQIERAQACRYHNLAMDVQGRHTHLYFEDYSGTITEAAEQDNFADL